MFISALKVVRGRSKLMTAVTREILLIVRENARKGQKAALRSWVWDDVDTALLEREYSLKNLPCLRHKAASLPSTVCVGDLYTLLQQQHALLIQECSCHSTVTLMRPKVPIISMIVRWRTGCKRFRRHWPAVPGVHSSSTQVLIVPLKPDNRF